MKPSTVIMTPRCQASIVVDLAILVGINAEGSQKFQEGGGKYSIANDYEVSAPIAIARLRLPRWAREYASTVADRSQV